MAAERLYGRSGENHQISESLVACRYALTRRTTVVMANILPFAETEPAILTDRDGFLASVVAFKAIHMDIPICVYKLIAHIKIRNDHRSITN
jgi:hypothetical protein